MQIAITKKGKVHFFSTGIARIETDVPDIAVWLEKVEAISCFHQTKNNEVTFFRYKQPTGSWFTVTYHHNHGWVEINPLCSEMDDR